MMHAGFRSGFPPPSDSPPSGLASLPLIMDNEKYLSELLSERQKLSPFIQVLPNCSRLLNQEIVRVTALVGCSTFMDSEVFESPLQRRQTPYQSLQPSLAHPQQQTQPLGLGILSSGRSPPQQVPTGLQAAYDTSTWAPLPSEIGATSSLFFSSPSTPNPTPSASLRWSGQEQTAHHHPLPQFSLQSQQHQQHVQQQSLAQTFTPLSLPPALPPSEKSSAPVVKRSRRIEVPVDQYPTFNFVGRILGPRGNSLKRVESQTGCRVLIRGRGSVKDPAKEEKLRDKPGYEHLREPLHVIVEAELPADTVDLHVNQACEILEELLKPVEESQDIVKKAQLRELAILNGTLREESPSPSQPLHSQQSGSFMKSPSPSASASSMSDSGMKRPKTRR